MLVIWCLVIGIAQGSIDITERLHAAFADVRQQTTPALTRKFVEAELDLRRLKAGESWFTYGGRVMQTLLEVHGAVRGEAALHISVVLDKLDAQFKLLLNNERKRLGNTLALHRKEFDLCRAKMAPEHVGTIVYFIMRVDFLLLTPLPSIWTQEGYAKTASKFSEVIASLPHVSHSYVVTAKADLEAFVATLAPLTTGRNQPAVAGLIRDLVDSQAATIKEELTEAYAMLISLRSEIFYLNIVPSTMSFVPTDPLVESLMSASLRRVPLRTRPLADEAREAVFQLTIAASKTLGPQKSLTKRLLAAYIERLHSLAGFWVVMYARRAATALSSLAGEALITETVGMKVRELLLEGAKAVQSAELELRPQPPREFVRFCDKIDKFPMARQLGGFHMHMAVFDALLDLLQMKTAKAAVKKMLDEVKELLDALGLEDVTNKVNVLDELGQTPAWDAEIQAVLVRNVSHLGFH